MGKTESLIPCLDQTAQPHSRYNPVAHAGVLYNCCNQCGLLVPISRYRVYFEQETGQKYGEPNSGFHKHDWYAFNRKVHILEMLKHAQ